MASRDGYVSIKDVITVLGNSTSLTISGKSTVKSLLLREAVRIALAKISGEKLAESNIVAFGKRIDKTHDMATYRKWLDKEYK